MRNFFVADLHFGHGNILRYDNRPFDTVEQMDAAMIRNWNDTVQENDTVYVLGDISWHREKETLKILSQLKGHKVLIRGNHDRVSPKIAKCFDLVTDYLELNDNGTRVVLSHYPMPFWNHQFQDSIHLYGHVHNSHQWNMCESFRKSIQELQDIPARMFNVGVMMPYMDYTPRTLCEILDGADRVLNLCTKNV